MPDLALERHRRAVPLDHPPGSVTREHLEYPTENVTFAYLAAINKTRLFEITVDRGGATLTYDAFADKAVQAVSSATLRYLFARVVDGRNFYWQAIWTGASTRDFTIGKTVDGSHTELAAESVDLSRLRSYLTAFSVSGSTLKAFRSDMTTPKITATDTALSSGYFGGGWRGDYLAFVDIVGMRLLAPMSPGPRAVRVLEVEVEGSGRGEDAFRPALARDLVRDERLGSVDKLSVTWGAFEFDPASPTNVVTIYGGNPYTGERAVEVQVERARARGLRALRPPRDYREAVELYRRLRADFPHWLAGKDNFAYQVLGHPVLEAFQAADLYYGELVEHRTHYRQLRRVPDWELRASIERLKRKLEKVSVLTEERDRHLRKLREVERLGW